jgi:hypothetical protein
MALYEPLLIKTLIITILIIGIYYDNQVKIMRNYEKINYDDIKFKTGDLIYGHYSKYIERKIGSAMGTFFTGASLMHVGTVVVINNIPHIFHYNNGISRDIMSNEFIKGLKIEELESYVKEYNGDVLWSPINNESTLTIEQIKNFDIVIPENDWDTRKSHINTIIHYNMEEPILTCSGVVAFTLDKMGLMKINKPEFYHPTRIRDETVGQGWGELRLINNYFAMNNLKLKN